jgi:hypothetical protein
VAGNTLGIDKRNRNTLRGDATTLEPIQINEYDTFIGKGHYTKVKTPDGLKKTQDQITQYQPMIDAPPMDSYYWAFQYQYCCYDFERIPYVTKSRTS